MAEKSWEQPFKLLVTITDRQVMSRGEMHRTLREVLPEVSAEIANALDLDTNDVKLEIERQPGDGGEEGDWL